MRTGRIFILVLAVSAIPVFTDQSVLQLLAGTGPFFGFVDTSKRSRERDTHWNFFYLALTAVLAVALLSMMMVGALHQEIY